MNRTSSSIPDKAYPSDLALDWTRSAGLAVAMLSLVIWTDCTGGSKYFEDAINQATQDVVGKRYGSPHKTQATVDGGEAWTYFERGSGTAGFGGQVRGTGCRAYVLTFDKERVLRRWQQLPCHG